MKNILFQYVHEFNTRLLHINDNAYTNQPAVSSKICDFYHCLLMRNNSI